jgi:replicative DNA helicase
VDTERTPPHDESAEAAVIGSMLLFPAEVLPLVGDLAIDDFMIPNHREAWAAILRVAERRMPIDVISVGDELRAAGMDSRFSDGWQAWAVRTSDAVGQWRNAGNHAAVVRAKSTLRKLISLSVEVQSAAYGNQPTDEVLARAREGVAALEVSGGTKGPEPVSSLVGDVMDAIEARQNGNTPVGVMTGIGALDKILTGLKPGRLYILGGRPGDGKTALAKGIALHAARNDEPALFFSREMSNQELVERDLSLLSRVPAYDIGGGRLDLKAWKEIQNAGHKLMGAKLWLDDRSTTIERIVAETRKWHAINVRGKGKLGMLVLDYLQLARLTKVRAGSNREQVVAEMSRSLKELGGELHIPVLVLSQLNRGAEERGGRPIPSDLRESGALEQDADVILFVYRALPPEDQEARRKPGPAEIIVGKHRGGPTGIAHVHFNTTLMQFADTEDYQEEPPVRSWHDQDGDDR